MDISRLGIPFWDKNVCYRYAYVACNITNLVFKKNPTIWSVALVSTHSTWNSLVWRWFSTGEMRQGETRIEICIAIYIDMRGEILNIFYEYWIINMEPYCLHEAINSREHDYSRELASTCTTSRELAMAVNMNRDIVTYVQF